MPVREVLVFDYRISDAALAVALNVDGNQFSSQRSLLASVLLMHHSLAPVCQRMCEQGQAQVFI